MGIGMQGAGAFMGAASQANMQQMQQQARQTPETQNQNKASVGTDKWKCSCGAINSSKFCPECGSKKTEEVRCTNCGNVITGQKPKFCPECGNRM
jgi:membrane protease subunit (stomatin/prohibitin family)